MIIEKEYEKIKKPISELTLDDLKPKNFKEYYIPDEKLINERNEFFKPIIRRTKFIGFFNLTYFVGLFYFCRNIHYYKKRFFPSFKRGFLKLIFGSIFLCGLFNAVLIGGNFLILGINSKTFFEWKDLQNRLYKDYDDTTVLKCFAELAQIQEIEEKKEILKIELIKYQSKLNKNI